MSCKGYRWQPLKPASKGIITEHLINDAVRHHKMTRDQAVTALEAEAAKSQYWINDLYQVQVQNLGGDQYWLNIRRRDGAPIHDWRHIQQIKNELLGQECEAVELYPAESRKTDASNKYHLWGVKDPSYRFPFGFTTHDVSYVSGTVPGTRQRPQSMNIDTDKYASQLESGVDPLQVAQQMRSEKK